MSAFKTKQKLLLIFNRQTTVINNIYCFFHFSIDDYEVSHACKWQFQLRKSSKLFSLVPLLMHESFHVPPSKAFQYTIFCRNDINYSLKQSNPFSIRELVDLTTFGYVLTAHHTVYTNKYAQMAQYQMKHFNHHLIAMKEFSFTFIMHNLSFIIHIKILITITL